MPIHPLIVILSLVILGYFFAKVEIHIEGKDGWAANLPTWRIEKHWLLDIFFGGRPLTGYHAWLLTFMLMIFHLPMVLMGSWTMQMEARIMASFMIFWIAEDFLWFILNPGWGLRRFNKQQVTWHRSWLLRLPTDYWTFGALSGYLMWYSFR